MDANLTIPANVTVRPATPDEVAQLKKDWEHDPCYDLFEYGAPPQSAVDELASAGGGELIDWSAHTRDLSEFQNVQEAEWASARRAREEEERKRLRLSPSDYRKYQQADRADKSHAESAKQLMRHYMEQAVGPLNADNCAELDRMVEHLIESAANRAAKSDITGILP